MPFRRNSDLPAPLLEHMQAIKAKAIEYGLDFFEVVFEVLDFETMNQIAAYGGFPVRYPHWRWGMEFERLSKRDAYGLGRIYEMVINNDPCYAYLQESNAVTDQKLVMAHVYGHADFFKRNAWFAATNRRMIDEMANHATRVRRHIEREGADAVERFIDCCLTIEHLIDPHSMFVKREPGRRAARDSARAEQRDERAARFPAKPSMDRYINPPETLERERREREAADERRRGKQPERPTRDVLLFLMRHAPLEPWQQDILGLIRDEAYYFAPQAMTKIMNEGWATYWHSKLMTSHFLEAREIIDYAEQHSGVVHMPPGGFNPYKVGVELFKDIEERWNTGRHGAAWEALEGLGQRRAYDDKSMQGREKIFEVRAIYNDVSFIDEFLTQDFIDKHKMYFYRRDPNTGEVKIVSRDASVIRQAMLYRIANMGQPLMYVVDANYRNRGELYLAHQWNGADIEVASAVEVLRNLCALWGRPVHLQARIDDDMWLYHMADPDGEPTREAIDDDTPEPAHLVA
jgi:stage V sporulation protein R